MTKTSATQHEDLDFSKFKLLIYFLLQAACQWLVDRIAAEWRLLQEPEPEHAAWRPNASLACEPDATDCRVPCHEFHASRLPVLTVPSASHDAWRVNNAWGRCDAWWLDAWGFRRRHRSGLPDEV